MPIWGKILGFLFGFMFLKLPGAILGLLVGHFFDRAYSQDFYQLGGFARFFSDPDSIKQSAIFFHSLFAALGHIAKSDGRVNETEIAIATALMDEMGLTGEAKRQAQSAFREGKDADYPLSETLKDLVTFCDGRRDLLQIFLEILIQASLADGHLAAEEQRVLERVASQIGFSKNELLSLINAFKAQQKFEHGSNKRAQQSSENQPTIEDAHQLLGIEQNADEKTVKRAYKKQMAAHHPDKLAAKGLPEQAREMAKQKTQAIQAAYALIKQVRGW